MLRATSRCNWAIAPRTAGPPESVNLIRLDPQCRIANPNSESSGFTARGTRRLSTGWFQLEQERTRELLLRYLPPPPATIIDAGGGSGVYACWLAARGYQVHLIDPVPKHVEKARAASAQQTESPLASAEVGDARHLSYANDSADAVLLLGPLYHLVEREDRLACLREAHRVVRPGGLVWGAGISHFASLLDSLSHGFFDDPAFAPIVERDLEDGQHRNPTDNPLCFTDAFMHRPGELSREFLAAGFEVVGVIAIEGPGKELPRCFSE